MKLNLVKVTFRTFGVINLVLAAVGIYALRPALLRIFRGHQQSVLSSHPYFETAFVSMAVWNVLFLALLIAVALKLIKGAPRAVLYYCALVVGALLYMLVIGTLWRAPQPIALSVAAATGVGNLGIAPFYFCLVVPFAYPLISAAVLLLVNRRAKNSSSVAVSS